jgi:ABC-type nitrate/sulfonate/bicarbonate transport system permease component
MKIKKYTLLLSLLSILLGIGIWSIIASFANASLLPTPIAVLNAFIYLAQDKELIGHILASLSRVILGFLIGSLLGLISAAITSRSLTLKSIILPWIEMMRPIPPLAWIPLAILWFGIGNKSAVFLVALGSFFPVYSNVYDGIISIQKEFYDAARVLGADSSLIFLHVTIPSVLPNALTGFRVGLGVSWMIVITAELVGATSGLGYFIQLNRILLQTDRVIVGMALIGILGFVMNYIITRVEKCLLRWQKNELRQVFI